MSEEEDDQKTEQPTGKRLGEARDEGKLPISREVSYWASFLGILIVVAWLGPGMSSQLFGSLRIFIESPHQFVVDDFGLQTILMDVTIKVLLATALIFLIMVFFIVAGYMVQTGFYASTSLITPSFEKLNFVAGFKKIFSVSSLVELVKSFGKLVIIGTAVFFTLWPLVVDLPAFTGRSLMDSIAFLHKQAVHLIIVIMMIYGAIALGDLVYQRYAYIKGLKMTKQEVKDEYKQQEGDPIIKGRLRQIRQEKARKRMMANVPKADVIITNPTHYAVALKYDSGKTTAPVVLAKGVDRVAERIRELAEENKITLVSNPPLARVLYETVEIDKEIPSQHYRAVAEVISYVYKLKKKKI